MTANRIQIGIRKKGKGVTGCPAQVTRFFRCIHADRYGSYAYRAELIQVFLNAPQLGVAGWSPVAAIEDQQDAPGRPAVDWLRQQFRQSHRFIACIFEGELRGLLADLW